MKERAARRAERERAAAARAEQRAAEAAKQARRRARAATWKRIRLHRRPVTGALARKRRAQNRVVFGLAAVVQLFGWLAFDSVRTSALLLVLTVFALPVVLTLAFDRRA